MILQMPHSFRWGDRAGVGISKIFAESVYDRCPRLACYVPNSGGERQIRHFSSTLFWCTRFSLFVFLLFTWPCDWRYYAYYLIFIEFTSKNCGESVPSRPDRTEIIYKSPEDLTKSVRFSGLFFLPRKVHSRGLHKTTIRMLSVFFLGQGKSPFLWW